MCANGKETVGPLVFDELLERLGSRHEHRLVLILGLWVTTTSHAPSTLCAKHLVDGRSLPQRRSWDASLNKAASTSFTRRILSEDSASLVSRLSALTRATASDLERSSPWAPNGRCHQPCCGRVSQASSQVTSLLLHFEVLRRCADSFTSVSSRRPLWQLTSPAR